MLFKPVVALCKLIFQHIRVFGADRVESVVLRGNVNRFLCFFLLCPLIDERELHRHGSVKVIEEIAPVFKNGGLVVCLCKLIVNVVVLHAFTVFLCRYPADTVRVHLQIGDSLLRGVRLAVALCLLDKGGDLFLFGAGQLAFSLCGACFLRLFGFCL